MFGESVLNDAVAIVLFRTFLREYQENESFTAGTLPSTLWSFFTISLASTSVGVLIGLSCSFLFKHTRIRDYPKFEISLLFLSSYGSYAFAEAVELSGIMSIFFTGVVLATYNTYNLSPTSQVRPCCVRVWLSYLSCCESFLHNRSSFVCQHFGVSPSNCEHELLMKTPRDEDNAAHDWFVNVSSTL